MMDNEPDGVETLLKAGRITNERGTLIVDINNLKRAKLLDVIRRAIANPQNIQEVVDEIALDWFPSVRADSKGFLEIVIGSGKKR